MAFIRWKKNRFGQQQAYLVHSYRDKKGSPRHITLAYLGKSGELTQEHIAGLKQDYPDLPVEWDKVKPAAPAKTSQLTDISGLSDEQLLRGLRGLRRERGMTIAEMLEELLKAGLPPQRVMGYIYQFERGYYGRLEKLFEREQWPEGIRETGLHIAPFARKVLGGV